MAINRSVRAPIIAILVITTAALLARSFLRVRLQEQGIDTDFAKDLSYLVVPIILGILLFPILRDNKTFLIVLFRRKRLTIRLVLTAFAGKVGEALREDAELAAAVASLMKPAQPSPPETERRDQP